MSRTFHTAGAGRQFWWWGGAALALLAFIRITRELMEGDVDAMDKAFLLSVARCRTPRLTIAAIDISALGSVTLVVLFSALALLLLLVLRDRMGALQLFASSAGAGILTVITKDIMERIRPVEVQQLVVAFGFSYPSGHSVSASALYLTIAIIVSRYLRRPALNFVLFASASAILILVAASRVYLGVHYATDVISGILLGAAWALLLAGLFARRGRPAGHPPIR